MPNVMILSWSGSKLKFFWMFKLLLVSIVPPTLSFSTGAPQAACRTLAPDATQHGAQPQATDIPYVLNLSAFYDQAIDQMVYNPDGVYNLILESTAAAPTFRGFLIQARLVADDTTVVGQFEEPPVGTDYQYGSCANTEGSVTHSLSGERSTITLPWRAPSNGTGTIHFGYAVVQTRQSYWANQRSTTIAERHPCLGDPCQNDGTCSDNGNETFTCSCHPAYSGAECERLVDPCALGLCQNGVNCTNLNTTDCVCDCGVEFTGRNCETAINHCDVLFNPNCNNGTCVDGVGKFACRCDPGYIGDFCDIDINECETDECENGECEDFINVFRCMCYPGWTGLLCDADIDECTLDSSRFGPCDDIGTSACIDGNSTYTCECMDGYAGRDCSLDIDPCDPNPCQNGGKCTNTSITTFECTCPEGYSGSTCSIDLTPCDPQPCGYYGNCTEFDGGLYTCECSMPYFLDTTIISCVAQCPLFTFGNHTSGQCQPFPAVLDDGIQADATAYFGNISVAAPFGTEVFHFRIVIDLRRFSNDLDAIFIIMTHNNLVETIFKFSDGQNYRLFQIGDHGGIDAVNASGVFPEIRLIENRLVVYEDSVIYNQVPPSTLELPTTLDFDLSIIVVWPGSNNFEQVYFAVGTVILNSPPPGHPCFENPCENGGRCSENTNPNCSNESCVNFTCQCYPGFTGDTCAINIDECETVTCQNGECRDIINAFQCICYLGWTGIFCDTDIDYCAFRDSSRFGPCDDFGTSACIDGNSTYTCECMDGYAGYDCSIDIDPCDPDPCENGGTCVNISITTFECTCPKGYTGSSCGVDLTPCDPHPCGNGNCTELDGGAYMCECSPPYYLDTEINSCSDQCPLFTFKNHTTGLCQPFPTVLENGVQADASAYFGSIVTTDPIGTVVFRFRIVIDLSHFDNDLNAIVVVMVRNNLVQTIFKLSDGENQRTFGIGAAGGIDTANATGRFPEITLLENRLVVFEDSVIYQQAPPSDLELPTTLDFDLNFIFSGRGALTFAQIDSSGTVYIQPPPDPCQNEPCQNGGTCIGIDSESFRCDCPSAYSGAHCEDIVDPCSILEPCQNGGTCTNMGQSDYMCDCGIEYTGRDCDVAIDHCALSSPNCNSGDCVDGFGTFTCECNLGYTGDFCDVEINECLTAGCQNGTCEDLVNAFRCLCYNGWTGLLCDLDIDYCAFDPSPAGPCNDFGATQCNDGNSTYTCTCVFGYTGDDCSMDINECDPNPCENGGNCTDFLFGVFECKCPQGYSGDTCINTTPCDRQPCANEGMCNDLGQGAYSCDCAQGFTGENCSNDIHFCQSDSCFNGGTCVEGLGTVTSCNCTDGFDGDQCEIDLPYCRADLCLNGGTCIEGLGTVTSCNCAEGFDGSRCDTDLDYCQSDLCLNGGTCIEDIGALTYCNCSEGFEGNRCDIDIDYCRADSCLNGGTCIEGLGVTTSCNCNEGFDGSQCEIDLPFCQEISCLNGGACIEGLGTITDCNCTQGFDGEHCEFDDPRYSACAVHSCENEGTCLEDFGPNFICCCQDGFSGTSCETDLNFCRPGLCLNGGICVEGIGSTTSCSCVAGFTGQDCGTALEGVPDAPLNGVTLDPIIWVIIGFVAGVALTALLCSLLVVFCYCTCFSARKEKRIKYEVQKSTESMMIENPGPAGTWVGISEVKHGSSSKVDPVDFTSTTTFI